MRVARDQCGVFDRHAFVSGEAAVVLVKLLGSWHRAGLSTAEVVTVTPAVQALNEAAMEHRAASARGNREGKGKAPGPITGAWSSTKELAAAVGLSERRIRQLQEDGLLDGRRVAGRYQFPPSTLEFIRARGEDS